MARADLVGLVVVAADRLAAADVLRPRAAPPLPLGEAEADGESDADGVVLGVGEPLLTEPVQVVPSSVELAGTGLLPVHAPLKPKLVLPPVPIEPL